MKITAQVADGVARLGLSGELDMSTTVLLREQVTATVAGARPRVLIIDAVDLDFCDSSGVQALVDARRRVLHEGIAFRLANPRGITRRTLQITGVLDVLTGE
ncbi:anti-sigma B factor antagonist [Actinoplanes octamycinicus]|uniref:Anti-sigma factor antagonist n=1 Tax=Actinoplanes octamycinicus TaxID=135948 RepID=A0A7W7H334_9ACTN|nr:anti-sigma factor antagonist [Actinoplanes octamycinicus]MBB4743106.1 anti-sigma B factor antagonist [Actinoplanes octamycinicus]GIE61332.1 anti-sigma factor antagonist [Actinoplanes octamycinicus]